MPNLSRYSVSKFGISLWGSNNGEQSRITVPCGLSVRVLLFLERTAFARESEPSTLTTNVQRGWSLLYGLLFCHLPIGVWLAYISSVSNRLHPSFCFVLQPSQSLGGCPLSMQLCKGQREISKEKDVEMWCPYSNGGVASRQMLCLYRALRKATAIYRAWDLGHFAHVKLCF